MMKAIHLLTLFGLLFATPALADDLTEVKNLMETRVGMVIDTLRGNHSTKEERNDKILKIVEPVFDFDRMAKISLGKTHWKALNDSQRGEFSNLFTHRLQESYLEKMDLYTDEKVVYDNAKYEGSKIYVLTHLKSKDDSIEMLYKLYRNDKQKKWLIYDIEIMGVSVVATYRSQFDGIMKKGGSTELMAKLRKTGEFNIPGGKKE